MMTMNSVLGVIILLLCAELLLQSYVYFVRELLCRERLLQQMLW